MVNTKYQFQNDTGYIKCAFKGKYSHLHWSNFITVNAEENYSPDVSASVKSRYINYSKTERAYVRD